MEQWIHHYRKQGVDHFYLIDNGSTDNSVEIVKKFDCITLFHDAKRSFQVGAYNKYILPIAIIETDYLAIFDLDEFAYCPGKETLRTALQSEIFKGFDQIWCPWLRFGSNGHREQPPDIIQGFTKRREVKGSILGKSIVKSSSVHKLHIHSHIMNSDTVSGLSNGCRKEILEGKQEVAEVALSEFQILINHYELQSFQWFHTVKITRGDVQKDITKFTSESFVLTDHPCTLTDTRLAEKAIE